MLFQVMYKEKKHSYGLKNRSGYFFRAEMKTNWQQNSLESNFPALIEKRLEQKTVSPKILDYKKIGHDFPSAIQTYR